MNEPQTVIVYNFRLFDANAETARQANFKATRERISGWQGAELLEGTAEAVPESEIDPDGRYRRIASGWGEL
jgi:hypothetical protein